MTDQNEDPWKPLDQDETAPQDGHFCGSTRLRWKVGGGGYQDIRHRCDDCRRVWWFDEY